MITVIVALLAAGDGPGVSRVASKIEIVSESKNGHTPVTVIGKDAYGNKIQETLKVPNDGTTVQTERYFDI